ncbi:hypothetical protein MRX96_044215 [Rhipicephalus microplus]
MCPTTVAQKGETATYYIGRPAMISQFRGNPPAQCATRVRCEVTGCEKAAVGTEHADPLGQVADKVCHFARWLPLTGLAQTRLSRSLKEQQLQSTLRCLSLDTEGNFQPGLRQHGWAKSPRFPYLQANQQLCRFASMPTPHSV